MQHKFNPHDWLPNDSRSDIDLVVSRIEASHTDITGSYADWVNLGFALADELGEGGRDYFHRISRFYPKYSYTDCNYQFDQCLKAKGHGITIKTLFHLAKQAGIEIGRTGEDERVRKGEDEKVRKGEDEKVRKGEDEKVRIGDDEKDSPSDEPPAVELPTMPDSVYETLPEFLKRVVAQSGTPEEKDVMLLGTLATLSACLPKVFAIYDNKRVFANLFLYITSQASAGKGNLVYCKLLVDPIHRELRRQSHAEKAQYEAEMREYNLMKMKDFSASKPIKPPEKMLFIPANNSTTGVFQLLSDNEGKGLISETEGDTLAQAFKSDYGNYSDGFRKAFHHECISYFRRTDREYVEINKPCLSAVLAGTPKQISALIPSAENGLFSRFMFYYMNIKVEWKDVVEEKDDNGLEGYYDALGQEFLPLYKALGEKPAIKFRITREQQLQFNAFFTQLQEKYVMLQGMDYIGTVRRLGLIAFRIGMIFTALRILETGDFTEIQFCRDDDFQAVLSMIRVLVRHASHVYSELPVDATPTKPKDKKEKFLEMLPYKFSRKDFLELAKTMDIIERTAQSYITKFCEKGLIFREQYGSYINLTHPDAHLKENGEPDQA